MEATATSAFVERGPELDAVRRALTRAQEGAGSAVIVEAPAGMGKSLLLAHAEGLATADGLRVLTARADPIERDFPYGIARQLFEPVLRAASPDELHRLLDGAAALAGDVLLRGATPGRDAAPMVAHALYWLAWGLAYDRPLLLVVDDAHWADRPSARTLLHLAHRVEDLPIVLLLAQRPAEPGAPPELAENLPADPAATVLTLVPLSPAGSAAVARGVVPDASPELIRRCHEAGGGNPLLVQELARVAAESGIEALAGDAGAHSEVLDRQVLRRLARLDPAPRAVVEALAVLGDDAPRATVAALAEVGVEVVSAARDVLVASGLLADGETLSFVHPLIRQAVTDAMPRGERAARHRRAAAVLGHAGTDPDKVAAHLVLSDPAGDAATVTVLRDAAERALLRGAPETATVYLRRALEEPPADDVRPDVLLELGTTEFDSGEPGAADRLRAALPALRAPASRIEALSRLAALAVLGGGPSSADSFDAEAARVADDPEQTLAVEVAALDVLLVLPGRQSERQARVAALPAPAARPGAYDRIALAHRAWMAAERGDSRTQTIALARQALEGDELLRISTYRISYHLATRALIVADGLDEADEALVALHEDATRRGSLRMQAAAAWYRSDIALRAGRVADAENLARLVLALHDDRDQILGGAVESLVNCLVERGELDEAGTVLEEFGWAGALGENYREVGLRLSRARLALARGDADRALAEALDCGRIREQQGRPNPAWTPWRSCAARACALLGEVPRAQILADEELALARRFGAPRAIGIALQARAAAAQDPGEALALRQEAVEVLGRSAGQLEHARALIDLGTTMRRSGDLVEAREPLQQAHGVAAGLGATVTAGLAREQLVATGLRPRRAQRTGVEALTPRQARVCELAAGGRTNREIAQELFVTVKTVETHLLAAYRKLDVASKADLAAALSG